MSDLHRRDFLALGSALMVGHGSLANAAAARTAPVAPPPNVLLPAAWHEAERIPLWPGHAPGPASYSAQPLPPDWSPGFVRNIAVPALHVFRPTRSNGRALLVLPGGAYWFVSVVNEGVDVAQAMTARGYTVFVLTYRLPGEGWEPRADVPVQDAQRAMRLIRAQAQRYAIDADRVAVLGFSAGGHLAATLATEAAERHASALDAIDELEAAPWAVALLYPVITMDARWTHQKSRELLLGEDPSASTVERRSAERQVGPATPPAFLVHAMDDDAVPVENSLRFLDALRAAGRPIEAHLIQEGGHAFGIGRPELPATQWIPLFISWLERLDARAAT